MRRSGFWLLALLWLPAGVALTAGIQSGGGPATRPGAATTPEASGMLLLLALCGLPLALGCRRLGRLGYRRGGWLAGIAIGAATVFAAQVGGLLGPVWVAFHTALFGAAVWLAWYLLARLR